MSWIGLCGGSWCTDSCLSPLIVKLPLIFEWSLLEQLFLPLSPSTQLDTALWTASFFSDDLLRLATLWRVSMSSAQSSSQQSSPWLWSLLNQTERPLKDSGNLYRYESALSLQYWTFSLFKFLRYWILGFHELQAIIIKIIRIKGLKYFTFGVMNL